MAMADNKQGTQGRHLVVGSLTTAQDKTYLAAAEKLETLYGKHNVEMQLWDRIIARATEWTSQSFNGSHVVLAASDIQGWTLAQLLNPIRDVTTVDGTLEVSISGTDPALLKSEIEESGYEVIATGTSVLAKRSPGASNTLPSGGGSVPLKLRRNMDKKTKATLWAVSDQGNDAELIDDESLLTEEDKLRPTLVTRPDCDVKRTRKACKNCTCGLRELELEDDDDLPPGVTRPGGDTVVDDDVAKEAVKGGLRKIKVKTGAVTSSCGSCYLGDAFRCSGCPYLGLPAFEPGQKVQLTEEMGDDV